MDNLVTILGVALTILTILVTQNKRFDKVDARFDRIEAELKTKATAEELNQVKSELKTKASNIQIDHIQSELTDIHAELKTKASNTQIDRIESELADIHAELKTKANASDVAREFARVDRKLDELSGQTFVLATHLSPYLLDKRMEESRHRPVAA